MRDCWAQTPKRKRYLTKNCKKNSETSGKVKNEVMMTATKQEGTEKTEF